MSTPKQKNLARLLEQHEEAVGRLYKIFAQKFKDHKQLWIAMSLEELIHASWIKKLYPQIKAGNLTFNESAFERKALKRSLIYIKGQTRRFQSSKRATFRQALLCALKIENFPFESRFFELYRTEHQEFEDLLDSLKEAFNEHHSRLTNILKKSK